MIRLIGRILTFSGKYKTKIIGALVFSFLKAILMKAPIGLAFFGLVAFYNNTATDEMCLYIGIAIIISLILQTIFQHLDNKMQASAGYMFMAEKRMELGAFLRKLPMGYFTEGNIGKISSVLSTDMEFVESGCMMVLADLMGYIFAEVILLLFMLMFDVRLGLLAILFVALSFFLWKKLEKGALKDSCNRQEQSENLTESVLDFTEGIGIIKTYNLLGEKSKELSEDFEKTCKTALEFEDNYVVYQRLIGILFGIGTGAVLGLAMFLNFNGAMIATAVVGMMLFVFDIFVPIKTLYAQSARLTIMDSCLNRIEEVFAEVTLADRGTEVIPDTSTSAEVEFKNVSFAYGEKEVLHNISFDVKRNSMAALVGPSGGGKSTIANLLPRFWDVKTGQILVRGKDIKEVKLADLMDKISMVFQRVYLFQDTIYNNISMGRPNATEEEVIEAAKKARCYDFIMALPDGFQTVVGEGGETLSGGEKQRISIARCILKDAPIVILDEATASVDSDNERYIQQAITELCKGKTLLVIAHRLNTIRNADKILVIAEGEIAQQGTHNELMEKEGIYKDFVTARQSSKGWSRRT